MLRAKYTGCLIGSALGDAIGEMAFQYPDKGRLLAGIERTDILRYTDDTAMARGVAQSIASKKTIDPEDLGRTFHTNFAGEPWRGYASGPPTIFSLVESTGMSYRDAAKTMFNGKGSFGNGAAMRVAPVGLYFHNAVDLYQKASASAEVTHAHPLAKDGAALQSLAVAQAVQSSPQQPFPFDAFIAMARAFVRTQEMQEKVQLIADLLERAVPCHEAITLLGKSVAIHESLPFAIFAFLRCPQSFEQCLFCAILNGGDRDTLGAMAGAISGAYLGIHAISQAWRDKLENWQQLEKLACSLLP